MAALFSSFTLRQVFRRVEWDKMERIKLRLNISRTRARLEHDETYEQGKAGAGAAGARAVRQEYERARQRPFCHFRCLLFFLSRGMSTRQWRRRASETGNRDGADWRVRMTKREKCIRTKKNVRSSLPRPRHFSLLLPTFPQNERRPGRFGTERTSERPADRMEKKNWS